ncbi:cytochrome P450 [Actinophytocola algeriensis]|uniref:Cytochrome P450 n=1 Tax=Actinophytocola algeriensis TaxID=1768010 RepID=A0A7W7Q6V7_9PSEU|nr:cytochrome P450 [Actinophytocola algeriensis]MBB4908177.1 cytochrome P450 [Actinophytocola algeriensis]MBE1480207.1 cytochrome P450 [Actinophytocola algeriensis]
MTDTELLFNPFLPDFDADPYPHYQRMRDQDPVHEHPLGFWLVTRYDDVTALLRAKLSVESGNLAGGPIADQFQQLEDSTRALSMLDRDPPDHTRLRALVTKVFTVKAIAALEPMVTDLVDRSLDRVADGGRVDLIDELAFPLPFAVISEMLGTPPADHERLRELSGTLVRSLEVQTDPAVIQAINDAEFELTEMMRDIIEWKRANPADDLLTALIAAEHDGDRLTEDELVAQVLLLYVAGHETTVNLIGNGAIALLRNPDQLALLRATPGLAANAVEELLRYDSPVQQSRRITVAPHTIGGREIPAGAFVIAGLASANRDDRHFGPDANDLRIDRADARTHVSFGAGPHHCLGAALARLEGRLALGKLVTRFPNLSLDGDVAWNGRLNLRGAAKLPVTV